jgi:ATP-dependent helicase/nuclease subunit B
VPRTEHLHLLLAKGREVFEPYLDMPEVSRFWWPRFARMAEDFISGNALLTADTLSTRTEISGFHDFEVQGIAHSLNARADRIDISHDGALRIIDYKSGSLPSAKEVATGFSPQLTLEAAIARRNGFTGINSTTVEDVMYIGVGGGRNGVSFRSFAATHDVKAEAEKAFAAFVALLEKFQIPTTAYIPRHNPKFESAGTDYDHLSRYAEWQLEGSAL